MPPLRIVGVFVLLLAAAGASAQTVPVPNASFEKGDGKPPGWTLSGGGEWHKPGGANDPGCLVARGLGKDSSEWRSAALPFKADTLYRLRFMARSVGASGGTPTSGTPFANRDLGSLAAEWTSYDSVFTTPRAIPPAESCLRFGQWEVAGAVAFRGPELCQAQAVYARQGDLALGEGESLDANRYEFQAPFQGQSRNHSRPLVSYTCSYNSDRWVFSPGTEVVYCHRLAGRKLTSAEVTASVTWYAHGELVVEAGTDGKTWQPLGMIDKLDARSCAVPASLLPAEAVWVRLRAQPKAGEAKAGGMALQVGGYGLKATVDGAPVKLTGQTRFVAITAVDPRLDVVIDDVGEGLPGGGNRVTGRITNKTGASLAAELSVTVDGRPPPDSHFSSLPSGESRLDRGYELPGPGTHTLAIYCAAPEPPGGRFAAQVLFHVADLYSSSFGEGLPASDGKVGLWWCSDGWKVSRARPVPDKKGQAVALSSARNGTVAAQVVVRPEYALKGLTAKASALTGPWWAKIPAENVEVLRVRYVNITHPTDSTGCVGEWPDPLPPLKGPIDCEAGKNQPLWVRVKVPADAKAGKYTGRILLEAEGWKAEAPLALEVYDFALPDRMTCQTAFGFEPANVWRYQKLEKDADRRTVLEKYLACLAAHHISPYDPAPLDPFKVQWPKGAEKPGKDEKREPLPPEAMKPAIDWTAWDAAVGRAIDRHHFNSLAIPVVGMGGGTFYARVEPELLGWREDTPQYKAAFTAYARAVQEHLREKGWIKYAYVYWFDEPDPKDYPFVMNGFRKLKEAAPDLARMLTEQVEPDLVGGPNLWCPITPEYKQAPADERRKAGERFWWYVCCAPKAPYATLFIDHPATELRAWLWQTWQRKIDGILVWSLNYWTSDTAYTDPKKPQDPYEDPASWVSGYGTPKGARQLWGNGDGRFLYPPEAAADAHPAAPVLEGPVESLRLEMLRDGIEDYEYLVMLRDLVAKKKDKLSEKERAGYAALLDVPPEITKDMTTFTKDPAPIEARRHAVAKAIEALRKR